MSSILFDPATTAGNAAGTRPPSKSAGYAPGNVSFDALLAKSQSKYEADAAYGSSRSDNERDYDTGRAEDFESEKSSDVNANAGDEVSDGWEETDDPSADPADQDAAYDEPEQEESDPGADGSEIAAVETSRQADEQVGDDGDETVAAAAATGNASAANDRSAAGNPANAAAGPARTAPQAAQAANAATPAAAQQSNAQPAANGNQPTNTAASVVNNNLHSQANTVLTNGSAVIALQSVDPKTGEPAGKAPAFDVLANPQAGEKPEVATAAASGKTAAQLAKLRQAGANGQTAATQPAGAVAATTQTAIGTANGQTPVAGSMPVGAETAGGLAGTSPAAGSGAPTFTSLAPVGGVAQTANATGAGAAASGNASAGAAAPSEQVAVAIHKGIAAGKDSITIKLNPAELGKIDVKMELSDDGTLRAVIAVEKPETLDLMQKDARGLERALQNAGLQADSGSLNFSLRGEGDNQAGGFETASGSGGSGDGQGDDGVAEDSAAESGQNSSSSHNGALDITV